MSTCEFCKNSRECVYPEGSDSVPIRIGCPVCCCGPFWKGDFEGRPFGASSASDRIEMVQKFEEAECRAALHVPGLQATVKRAVHQQLKHLARLSALSAEDHQS